jgi:hypothetical protein
LFRGSVSPGGRPGLSACGPFCVWAFLRVGLSACGVFPGSAIRQRGQTVRPSGHHSTSPPGHHSTRPPVHQATNPPTRSLCRSADRPPPRRVRSVRRWGRVRPVNGMRAPPAGGFRVPSEPGLKSAR